MTAFIYKAINTNGELVEAVKDAANEQMLVQALQQDGLMPISVSPAKARPFFWLFPGHKLAKLPQKDFKTIHFKNVPLGNKRYILCSKQVEARLLDKLNGALEGIVQ